MKKNKNKKKKRGRITISLKDKINKFKTMFALSYLAIMMIIYIILRLKLIGENDNILLFAIGSIPLFYLIISLITFDKNHKIISSLTIILIMYFIYKWTNVTLSILNTTFESDSIKASAVMDAKINITYAMITFILAHLFVKASEYIKTAQEEYEEKMSTKKEN